MTTHKRCRYLCLLVVSLCAVSSSLAARPSGEFLLWTGSAPGALGSDYEDMPTLTPYFAAETNATGAAMIVCPGGGYSFLSDVYEGYNYALWLNELGISAFVLKYRLGSNGYHHPIQMWDAQRAIRYVRANSNDWNLDPARVGIIGASAGGHLAATTMVHFDDGDPGALDPVERVSCRPDVGVLCYPVITMSSPYVHDGSKSNLMGDAATNSVLVDYLSCEKQVSSSTPPAFVFHNVPDNKVPYQNSTMFADALASNSVPHELYLHPTGGHGVWHGLGAGPGDMANYHQWTDEAAYWLFKAGFGLSHLGNIWALGDSITDGAAQPAWVPGGYRETLCSNLTERGYGFQMVGTRDNNPSALLTASGQQWHDGWSGYTIAGIEGRSGLYENVTAWHAAIPEPDLILLKIGINDLNHDWEVAMAPDRLGLLVDRLFSLSPDARILVSTLVDAYQDNPYRGSPAATNDITASVVAYNVALASMVSTRQAQGQNIALVDMHAGLTMADLSDGLHPNAGGYEKMGDIWTDGVEGLPDFTTNAIEVINGTVVLTARGTVGTRYSLWSTSNPVSNDWNQMTNDSIRTDPIVVMTTATNSARFYRFSTP